MDNLCILCAVNDGEVCFSHLNLPLKMYTKTFDIFVFQCHHLFRLGSRVFINAEAWNNDDVIKPMISTRIKH